MPRIPLAWYNLIAERRRLLTSLAGVTFAVILMFMFQGFQNALFDSQIQLLRQLNADIVMVNRLKANMFVPAQFARNRLFQAQSFAGVEAASALYITNGNWQNPQTRETRPLRVLAFNLSDPVLPLPEVLAARAQLQHPWTVLIDSKARAEIGDKSVGVRTELAEQQVEIVGQFSLGTDFASGNGNLIMSDQNFVRYFANLGPAEDNRALNTVDIGLLRLVSGTDVAAMVETLRQNLPADVLIMSQPDFAQRERQYWQENTNIGFVFTLLTAMGFAVGIILVYQILYTDVADHWAEYATLKAIGYTNVYLLGVVLQAAIILSLLGFIPGLAISFYLYNLTATTTGLLMQLTLSRVLSLWIATIAMCLISGMIAVRKVQAADPAEVFG